MAKGLLWMFVIVGFLISIADYAQGESMQLYTKVVILSSLGVLAICESIEKGKKA